MKQIVYFVRHAKYHNPRGIFPGRLPVPLSAEGRKQAAWLRDYFKDKNIERIYSSAVLRCKQTAETIANDTIPIVYDRRLLETFSAYQGYWGLQKHLLTSWDDFFSHREELGGESYKDIENRMVSFYNDIIVKETQPIIVCSHGDPLQMLYYHLCNKPLPSEDDEKGEFGNPLYQPKGSVRKMEMEDGVCTFCEIETYEIME